MFVNIGVYKNSKGSNSNSGYFKLTGYTLKLNIFSFFKEFAKSYEIPNLNISIC